MNMEEQDIKNGNKLIAEFMGYKFGVEKYLVDEGDEYNYKFIPHYRGVNFKDKLPENVKTNNGYDFREYTDGYDEKLDYNLRYHSSYDSLIPVVKKINKTYEDLYKQTFTSKIPMSYEIESAYGDVICRNVTIEVEHLFERVINFVKWYNERIN